MKPIKTFLVFAKDVAHRPFWMLDDARKSAYVNELRSVASSLVGRLKSSNMEETKAYASAVMLENAVANDEPDEPALASALTSFALLPAPEGDGEYAKQADELSKYAQTFRKRANAFAHLEAAVRVAAEGATQEQIDANDKKVLEETGRFYVWEYTLQLDQELKKLPTKEERKEAVEKGIDVEAGELPALLPLLDSFQRELAFKLWDPTRRRVVVEIFYRLMDGAEDPGSETFMTAFAVFHAELLQLAIDAGLEAFTGTIYKPYPDGTSYADMIDDQATNAG